MRDRRAIQELKDRANERREDVLAWLGIRERVSRAGYISMCNPKRKDKRPSLTIWLKGGVLTFKDHADHEAKGDIFNFIAYINGWTHLPHNGFPEVCRWLEDKLGIKKQTEAERDRDARRSRARREVEQRNEAREAERKERQAFAMWLNADPGLLDTPVDLYLLNARGIDLRALPKGPRGGDRIPDVLRYLSNHPHTDKRGRETKWPCMVAGCVDYASPRPAIRAVHRTWLDRNGSGKAPVEPARKCFPSFAGLVIPLWRGDTNMTVRQAIENGVRETIVLTEGVEDGLTAALASPVHRVWAMIALGNMANVAAVLPECCDSVIIHRQNDWNKLQAVEQFERGKAAIEATGRPVAEVAAFAGKDLNDTLRGAA